MITKTAEATKERLSLLDKKMLRDPKAHNISVLQIRRVGKKVGFGERVDECLVFAGVWRVVRWLLWSLDGSWII